MCSRRVRNALPMIGIALAAAASTTATQEARADSIVPSLKYNTSGAIGSGGVSGASVVSFNGVANATLDLPSTFAVGTFQVAALPAGASTTYTDTPISISFLSDKAEPLTLTGVLNGTVNGGSADLRATFQTIEAGAPVFQPGPGTSGAPPTLDVGGVAEPLLVSLLSSTLQLEPAGTGGGQTALTAQAQVIGTVPEPATSVLLLAAMGSLGLARRLRGSARN